MAGLKLVGLESTIAMIRNDMERSNRNARRRMDREAEEIKKLSQSYAPVDEGDLEAAHHIIKERDDSNRKVIYIEVSGSGPNKSVDGYAERMHESVYNLGPKSLAKDGGSGKVGRKYLQRALEEREPHLNEGLAEEVKRSL
jgi:hypothetical protein